MIYKYIAFKYTEKKSLKLLNLRKLYFVKPL